MDFIMTLWGAGDVSSFHHILLVAWRILLVVLGVNALIIVHEFGHFIVARCCGVRCDKFYIWFDAYNFRFFRFKWGDTEYGLGWVPLGGYVKMLGQEDNPSGIKEEIDRAREQGNLTQEAREELAEKEKLQKELFAPNSYLAKNVFQRMAIISAGVIMNVIFAVICAACAFMLGFPEPTSRLGEILPNTPAWKSGLLQGDKITAIDGKPCSHFTDIRLAMLDRKPVELTVERNLTGTPETIKMSITPTMAEGQMTPTIGIFPSPSILLSPEGPVCELTLDSAENAKLADLAKDIAPGSILTAMNDTPVNSAADYQRLARKYLSQPITYEFAPADSDGTPIPGGERHTITLPPKPLAETGIRLKMGEITAVADNSPASNAGIRVREWDAETKTAQPGDIPVAVNNEPILDPIAFPYQIHQLAAKSAGSTDIVLTVSRDGKQIDVPLSISEIPGYTGETAYNGSLSCREIGISYFVTPFISGTEPSVQVSSAPSPIGLPIESIEVELTPPDDPNLIPLYSQLLELGKKRPEGGFIYQIAADSPKETMSNMLNWSTIIVNYLPTGTPLKIHAGAAPTDPVLLETKVSRSGDVRKIDRGLQFLMSETEIAKAPSFVSACTLGWHKTVDSMGAIFRQLKNIGRNVSPKAFGGPVMIVDVAYKATSTGDGTFLLFLCLISANLAVVNILPIPVLDGGHLLFLLYELIFRKPPNETVQVILSYIGLFLILGLMVWVLFLDFARIAGLL